MGQFHSALAPACLVLLAVISINTSAEDLETVVVTAARTPVNPDEVGSSMTIISAEEIEQRQVANLADILRDVPGLAVSRSGGPGASTQIRVRGAEANHVLVLIDGIEANDPAQGSEFNFANVLTDGIERIEVVRGPQSALWGSDALAGVINIITAPGAGPPTIAGYVEAGSFATRRAGGSIAAGADRYHFNLNGSVLDSGGTNVSRQGDEDEGFNEGTVSLNAAYTPAPELEFTVNARHEAATSQFDNVDFLITGLPSDSNSETETRLDYAGARAKLSLLDGHWEQRLGATFTGTRNDNFNDRLESGSGAGRKYRLEYQTSGLLETPRLLGSTHVLTFALEHELEDFRQRGPATPFGDPNQDLNVRTTAIVGEYRVRAAESLSFSAGVRHDANSDFADTTTLRFTATWDPPGLPGTRLHSTWGEGVKNPTFSDRFGFFAESVPPFIGNPDLKPESSQGWDAGVAQALFGGRLRLGVTHFRERLEDEIDSFVFDPSRNAFTAMNTGGTSWRQGIEVTAAADLSPGLKLNAAYTWLDAVQPDAAGGETQEVRRPRHVASINANYAFAGDRANINLNVAYTGAQSDTFFPPFPRPAEEVALRDFTLVTLAGSYRIAGNLSLYARVDNLLDRDYEEVFGYQAPGISASAGIRLSWQP